MDRKPEILSGQVVDTPSSDASVEQMYRQARNNVYGTTDPVDIAGADIYTPRPAVPTTTVEEIKASGQVSTTHTSSPAGEVNAAMGSRITRFRNHRKQQLQAHHQKAA